MSERIETEADKKCDNLVGWRLDDFRRVDPTITTGIEPETISLRVTSLPGRHQVTDVTGIEYDNEWLCWNKRC